ncbi:DUF262 domain-containing protein [Helicobacter sp. MIT 14-3879]|uniref:DUF262 domain-containing protein n=1 Tax=Helicobacter sp. MIT 14-3879 TaxID=2040649 RepID=UPI0026B9CA9F|nr:DUF262 domain-containing protein [Helicobacter sp. MIT 14-3879]
MSQETLKKVLSRDKFSIPKYQRDYAWKKKNFEELWEDLEEIKDSGDSQGHFLGTIVVAPNAQDSERFDIIDGQQRITTIFMLLYALVCKSEFKDNYKIKFLTDKRGDIKLEVAPQNKEFLKELLKDSEKGTLSSILKEKADTKGKENLYEVFESILDKVSNLDSSQVKSYIETLLKMVLMYLEEPNSGRAIRTFQSVNDRGVPLNLLDKLKSLLIYYSNIYCNGSGGLDEEINNTFGDIFRIFLKIEDHRHISSIGNQQFGESDIFRYHAGSIKFEEFDRLGQYRDSSENIYEKLKIELKKLSKNDLKRRNLENFIKTYIIDLRNFYQSFLNLLNEIDTNPYVFKLFLLEKVNPHFYNSLIRLKINNNLDDRMITLIAKMDILFFKSGSSLDATAYNLIDACLMGKRDFENKVIDSCKKNANIIRKAIDDLLQYAYETPSFHYIFFEQNCQNMDIDALKNLIEKKQLTQEKEHIIPKNLLEIQDEVQAKKLGFDNLEDLNNFINSYGNLLSLEKNLME